jgi:hypothetical protein
MFTYAGGKHRIQLIAAALIAVSVPVRCIVDFDVLNNETTLRRLVESLGHPYPEGVESLRRVVDAGIRGREAAHTRGRLRAAITDALSGDDASPVDSATISRVHEALEPPAGWAAAKKKGRAEVPPGEATVALDRLLSDLRGLGVFVVPTGAVESWVKAASHRGPSWVVEVIEKSLIIEASESQRFVTDVLESLAVT